MVQTEAQKRASKKWRSKHLKNMTVSIRKEFVEDIDTYLQTEAGQRFHSRSNLVITLLLEQMRRDGYEPKHRP